MVFLMDVRCSCSRIDYVCQEIGFSQSFLVHGTGTGGGIALLWDSSCTVQLRSHNLVYIDVNVIVNYFSWRFTGIYGHPKRHLRHTSWALLKQLATSGNEA